MIKMQEPSYCYNSCDVPGPHYNMWYTDVGVEGTSPSEVIGRIRRANGAALVQEGKSLRNVIINCHGGPGYLYVGGLFKTSPGFDVKNVDLFGALKAMDIGAIFLVACRAALDMEGLLFCNHMAVISGCQVIAADDFQEVTPYQTYRYYVGGSGIIDDFEGTVYAFTPGGRIIKGIDPEDYVQTVEV